MSQADQIRKYLCGRSILLIFLSIFSLLLTTCTPRLAEDTYAVAKVIDGDTIELTSGEKLRYIGIDTPEKAEPFYQEAKNFNRKLVEGKKIRIEFDVQKRDKYGRLLGYVYVDDIFVNAELLKAGLAVLYTYPPNVKYVDYFTQLQKEARQLKSGIWSEKIEPEQFYLAVKGSKRFHRPDCRSLQSAKEKELLKFNSREEALDKGFSPCRRCKP